MSTHIVDRIEAIRFPAKVTGHYCDRYLVCELGGDSNVRCARTNRRARTWSATAIGEEWEIIGQACRFVAQNAVQLHGGMGMTDEMILSHWFKRLTAIEMSFGDTDFHLQRFARLARAA